MLSFTHELTVVLTEKQRNVSGNNFHYFTLLNSPHLMYIIISIKLWYQSFALNVCQADEVKAPNLFEPTCFGTGTFAVLTSVVCVFVCVAASVVLLCWEDEDRSDRAESIWPGGVQGAEEGRPHHRWSLHHPRQGWKG